MGNQIKQQNEIIRTLQSEFSCLNSSLNIQDLKSEIKSITDNNMLITNRIDIAKSGNKKIDAIQKNKVVYEYNSCNKLLKERKIKVKEILDELLENISKSKEDLMEEIGINMS